MNTKTVFGVFIIMAGIFTIIGGATGNLGVMIAALLDPSDLASVGSSQSTEVPGAPGGGGGGSSGGNVPGEPGGGLIAGLGGVN
jgi:hypothetical protein